MTRMVVIDASLSESGSSTRLAKELLRQLPTEWECAHIQLRPLARDLADCLLVGFPTPSLEAAYQTVAMADVAVVTTPIYQSSYSGLLKLFLDLLPNGALAGVPVVAAATGGSTRHAMAVDYALRPLLTYLRAHVVPTGIYAAAEDWGATAVDSSGDEAGGLGLRVKRAAQELMMAALVKGGSAPPGGAGDAAGGTSADKDSFGRAGDSTNIGVELGTGHGIESRAVDAQKAQTAHSWEASVRGDQFASFTPFEELLSQVAP